MYSGVYLISHSKSASILLVAMGKKLLKFQSCFFRVLSVRDDEIAAFPQFLHTGAASSLFADYR